MVIWERTLFWFVLVQTIGLVILAAVVYVQNATITGQRDVIRQMVQNPACLQPGR